MLCILADPNGVLGSGAYAAKVPISISLSN